MEFLARRKKNPPSVIIVALIDVLIVVLIFLLVTTTFKQQPAIKLTLPESSQGTPEAGASELNPVTITIAKNGDYYYGASDRSVSQEELRQLLEVDLKVNPQLYVQVALDTDSPAGALVKAIDTAKIAGVKSRMSILTKAPDE